MKDPRLPDEASIGTVVSGPNTPTPLSEPRENWMRAVVHGLSREPAYLLLFAVVVVVSMEVRRPAT